MKKIDIKSWSKTFNKRLKSYKPLTKDEKIKYLEDEILALYERKNPTKTFIGGIVIGFILGLFAGAVFISNVMLN